MPQTAQVQKTKKAPLKLRHYTNMLLLLFFYAPVLSCRGLIIIIIISKKADVCQLSHCQNNGLKLHYFSYIICNEVTCRHIADLSLTVLYQPPLVIRRINDGKLVANSTLQDP